MSKKSKEELEKLNFETPSPERRPIFNTPIQDQKTLIDSIKPQPKVHEFTNVKNWRSQFNKGNYNGEKGEIKPSQQPSQTIPDQTLSIREILYRHSIGAPINALQRIPQYENEGDIIVPDFNRMDLAEIQEYKEQLTERINERKRINEEIEKQQQYNAELKKAEFLIAQKIEKQKQKEEREQKLQKEAQQEKP